MEVASQTLAKFVEDQELEVVPPAGAASAKKVPQKANLKVALCLEVHRKTAAETAGQGQEEF